MRFYEIVDIENDNHDMFDYMKSNSIIVLDKIYDELKLMTNDFDIPYEWINDFDDNFSNNRRKIINIIPDILKSFPGENNRWNIKINKLKKYFDIP